MQQDEALLPTESTDLLPAVSTIAPTLGSPHTRPHLKPSSNVSNHPESSLSSLEPSYEEPLVTSHHAPLDSSSSWSALPAVSLAWTPMPHHPSPGTLLSPETYKRWLTPAQFQYINQISTLGELGTKEAVQEALELFESIPPKDQQFLYPLMLKPNLLRLCGREREAYLFCIEQLCDINSESLWVEYGGIVWEWLQHPQCQPQDRQDLLRTLQQVCETQPHAPPRLILAQLLQQQHGNELPEILKLYKAVLRPEPWQPYFKTNIAPWLPQIAHSLFLMIDSLHTKHPKTAVSYAQAIPVFPWEHHLTETDQNAFESLCLALLRLQLHKEIKQICERMQRKMPHWSRLAFWLGYTAYLFQKPKQCIEFFQKATQLGHLERHHLLNMIPILLSQGHLIESRQLLDQFADTEDIDYLKMEIEYCNQTNQTERGLAHCKAILQRVPNHTPARFYQAVWFDETGQVEDAIETLLPLLDLTDAQQQAYARTLLAGLHIKLEQYEQAYAFLSPILPVERSFSFFKEDAWRRTLLLNLGIALEHTGHPQEAIPHFRKALLYSPESPEAIYGHILDQLCELQRFDEALELGHEAIAACPHAPRLKFALAQLQDYFGQWKESLKTLRSIGLDWFRQEERLPEGIVLHTRAMLGQNQPLQALAFCEDLLPDILENETLCQWRQQIFKEVQAQFDALHTQLGNQKQQYQQLEETQRMLARQREENRRRERAYQTILQKHEGLKQTLEHIESTAWKSAISQAQQFATTASAPPPLDPALTIGLSEPLLQILQSAEHLWHELLVHPQQDHGPILLQLARVLEGQLNQALIDPLCQWLLSHGYHLSDLPRPSVVAFKPKNNRLSLGDAAAVLYHKLQQTEPDGTLSIVLNPRSNDAHRTLLEEFWSTQKQLPPPLWSDLQHALPNALLRIAKARNHAGHANSPLTRAEVSPLRDLILGTPSQPGILAQLTSFSQHTTRSTGPVQTSE